MNAFARQVADVLPEAQRAHGPRTLELNVGLRCNMRCAHCHQSSSPDRTEAMTEPVFALALAASERLRPELVDVTGGAPELHPSIRRFVRELRGADLCVQVRTNLTAFREPGCGDLPAFFAEHGVNLLASLPSFERRGYAAQRGNRSDQAIGALRELNALGYGRGPLRLDIAYNPPAGALAEKQHVLEERSRRELGCATASASIASSHSRTCPWGGSPSTSDDPVRPPATAAR